MIDTGALPRIICQWFSHLSRFPVIAGLAWLCLFPAALSGQYEKFEAPFWYPDSRNGLPKEEVLSLAISPDDLLFIGYPSGLFSWNGQRGRRFSGRQGLPSGACRGLVYRSDTLFGIIDTITFSYDGAVFTREKSKRLRSSLNADDYPQVEAPGDIIYTGTESGLLIEYRNGWERLITERCDMPWSVIPDTYGQAFLLSCHLAGFQRYDDEGRYLGTYALPLTGLPSDRVQLFPGYFCREEYGCLAGGYRSVYGVDKGEVNWWGRLEKTYEAFAWDPVSQQVFAAGSAISFLRPDGIVLKDQIALPEGAVGEVSAADMLVDEKEIWVAGILGVARQDRASGDWEVFNSDNGRLPERRAYHLFRSPHGHLFAGLQNGIALWDDREKSFRPWLPELIGEQVGQVINWHRDTLIVVSATHCYFFHENRDSLHLFASYGLSDGLDLLEFNENGAMIDSRDRLYLPGPDGVHRFDLKRLRDLPPLAGQLQIMSLGDQLLPFSGPEDILYPHYGKRLELSCQLSGIPKDNAMIEYRIDKGDWQPSPKVDVVTINVFPSGQHLLQLRARVPGLETTAWPVEEIRVIASWPPLEHPYNQMALALVTGLVIVLLVYFNSIAYRERRQLRRLKRMMIKASNRAMEVQLNPAFIMKSIDGIKQQIRSGERKKASQHLVHLARTIRQLLDISLEERGSEQMDIRFTSLENELKFLRNLIQLEQNRRPGQFSYILSVDEELWEEDPQIPALLLPPMVIWLINLEGEGLTPVGKLRLTIDGTPEDIRFTWHAEPVPGLEFDVSELWFSNSPEGRSLSERAALFDRLGCELTLEPKAEGEYFELVMVFRGRE